MGRRLGVIGFIFILFFLWGCEDTKVKDTQQIALEYLENKDYEIVSTDEKVEEYILKKEDLLKLPYQNYWGVQNVNASEYIGKTIEVYRFIVKNHPLDSARNNEKNQTIVWVMIHDNKPIGGYSLPDYSEQVYGGVYSLEGKTLEEVTGMDFQEWREIWNKGYQ